ncbi:MAG: DUF1987 domain-containing protein [Flavobacteriales bacterium]|nr:DUF1987 domain-containing protein [Flavobacteriales bacterium]
METLNIPATANTPAVSFSSEQSRFLVTGNSIPENANNFFRPIMEWLDRNLEALPKLCTFEFNLPYFNSSSLKAIYLLLMEIRRGEAAGKQFHIAWYTESGDEFMEEAAESFIELTNMPIHVRTGAPVV